MSEQSIGRIATPIAGQHVGRVIPIRGSLRPGSDDDYFWIANRRVPGGLMWPKEPRLTLGSDGSFAINAFEGGAPGNLVVSLLAVDRHADRGFTQWLQEGHRTGDYPGLHPRDYRFREMDSVDVVYDPAGALQSNTPGGPSRASAARRVFVVHGHDQGARLAVTQFLKQLRIEPILLDEQPNEGRTLIEKFEHYSDVPYAIVLLTADDVGADGTRPGTLRPRPRQNVILELGYFIGRLSRRRVCALFKGDDIDLPSDIDGTVYEPLDPEGRWKKRLVLELQVAGIHIDSNEIV